MCGCYGKREERKFKEALYAETIWADGESSIEEGTRANAHGVRTFHRDLADSIDSCFYIRTKSKSYWHITP